MSFEMVKTSNSSEQKIYGAIIVALVMLIFLFTYGTHFAGLRSGSGLYPTGVVFLENAMPYRDYYCPITCLTIIKAAALLSIFGPDFIVLRIAGILVRVGISLITYFWLSRMFRPKDACLATIICMIVSCGDRSDMLDSPNFDAIFYGVAAGLVSSFCLDANRTNRATIWFATAGGCLAGLSLLSKQSVGVGISFFIPLAATVCLLGLREKQKAICFFSSYVSGWLAVIGAGVLWVHSYGGLPQCLNEIFVKGPSAKGNFVLNQLSYMAMWWGLVAIAFIGSVLVLKPLRTTAEKKEEFIDETTKSIAIQFMPATILTLSGIAIGCLLGYSDLSEGLLGLDLWGLVRMYQITLIYFAAGTMVLLLVIFALRIRKLSHREAQLCLITATAFAISAMISLSFAAFEPMVLPSLAIILAAVLDSARSLQLRLVYIFSVITISTVTFGKLIKPFAFSEWADPPVRFATCVSEVPRMKGFVLPPETVDFIDNTVRLINENSTPDDYIFIAPDLGLFHPLTDRRWPTRCYSHNIDITTNEVGKSEAALLLKNRPAVFVYQRISEKELKQLEDGWREGKPSALRYLEKAFRVLAKEYRLLHTFDVCNLKVSVYARPHEATPVKLPAKEGNAER